MALKLIDLTTPQPGGKFGDPTKTAWEKTNDNAVEIEQRLQVGESGGAAGQQALAQVVALESDLGSAAYLEASTLASSSTVDALQVEVSNIAASQGSGVVGVATLADIPTGSLGPGDAGKMYNVTNDPTAANNGAWRWSGSALVKSADRTSELSAQVATKADEATVKIVAGYTVAKVPNILKATRDASGRTARVVYDDGTYRHSRLAVGSTLFRRDAAGDAVIDGKISMGSAVKTWLQDVDGGLLEGALRVKIDRIGRVGRIEYKDGRPDWVAGQVPGTPSWKLDHSKVLPDGASGQNPNGGFTCTGLALVTSGKYIGCWLIANDGRVYEGTQGGVTSPFLSSVVLVTPDFARIIREDKWHLTIAGIESIQGLAWDNTRNQYMFVDKTNQAIRYVSQEGVLQADPIVVTHTPNGVAYDPVRDVVISPGEGTTNVFIYTRATGLLLETVSGIAGNADQLYYDAQASILYYSLGANAEDGAIRSMSINGGPTLSSFTLAGSQAIEGIYIFTDARGRRWLYVVNDGAFHATANPPLAIMRAYIWE